MSRRVAALLLAVLVACSSDGGAGGDVDTGFVQDMADHHEQAVRMALIVLAKDDISPVVRAFATDVVASQRYELGLMDAHLDFERGAPDREVMAWMDAPMPLAEMPGMATPASLDELAAAGGRAADDLFLALMIEHHRGGLHMAELAEAHADDDDVRDLAERIVFSQTEEIAEMEQAQRQLASG
jgi:uncharacterized protein (DUF305 family)